MTFSGNERYQILEKLGSGSFGVVFSAIDRHHGDRVALKTLRHLNATSLYRFKKEFRSLAGVSHPNLVSLYELGSDGESWFMTMELVPGVDLLTHLRGEARSASADAPTTDGSISPSRPDDAVAPTGPAPDDWEPQPGAPVGDCPALRQTFKQLASGVGALHAAGKLHRDIKPTNILVTPEGRVVLLDFGLVLEQDLGQSTEQHVMGTAAYMAPEQATDVKASAAADWYSVGVILYEALTGQLPHEGQLVELLMAKQAVKPRPPHELVPSAPEDLSALCIELLAQRPEDRPSNEEALAGLGADCAPGPGATNAPARRMQLVGREKELAALQQAYRSEEAALVHVSGRTGMGKSALVLRFIRDLAQEEPGPVCLTGRCYPRESVPYKALDTLMDDLCRHLRRLKRRQVEALIPRDAGALARLFPVLKRVDAVAQATLRRPGELDEIDALEARRRGVEALRDLLGRMARHRRLVLVLDDLQWGDTDSAGLLQTLLRPPDPPPLLLLACYRSEDRQSSAFLRRFDELEQLLGQRALQLELEPLDPDDARRLARQLLPTPKLEGLLGPLTAGAEGNPLFITEVARYAAEAPGDSDLDGALGLEQVLSRRIHRLPEPARRLLSTVAVAGQPISETLASRAARLNGAGRAALTALRADHLVRLSAADETLVECYHDRVRQVVMETMEPATRARYHWRLARALEPDADADPESLMVHLEGAGELARAGAFAVRAAERAADALAFDRAAALYERALRLGQRSPKETRVLKAALGRELANAGRGHEAARALLDAAQGRDDRSLELQRQALEQLLISGHIDEGLSLLQRLGSTFGIELPGDRGRTLPALIWSRARLRLRGLAFTRKTAEEISPHALQRLDLAMAVARGLGNVDPIRTALLQTHCLRSALDLGEPARVALALGGEVIFSAVRGSRTHGRTTQLLDRLHDVGETIDDQQLSGFITLVDGMACLLGQGRFASGLRRLDEAAELLCGAPSLSRYLGRQRDRLRLDMAQIYGLECLSRLGRIRELTDRMPPLLIDADQRGNRLLRATFRTGAGHIHWLAAHRPEELQAAVTEVMSEWSQQGFHLQHLWELWARCQILLYQGHVTQALLRLEARWTEIRRSVQMRTQLVLLDLLHLRGRLRLAAARDAGGSERRRGLLAAAQMVRAIEREGVPHGWPLARLLAAGIAATRGNDAAAARLLGEAAEGFARAEMGLFEAAANQRLGRLLGGDEGQQLVTEAEAFFQRQRIARPERLLALMAPGF